MLTITKAGKESIPIIQQIAYATWPVAYKEILSAEQLQYMLALFYSEEALTRQMENGQQFYMASDYGQAQGFAAFTDEGNTVYKLQKLYVLPSNQKTGAGKLLLQYVEEEIRKLGGTRLILNVNRANTAKYYYEKIGFSIIKEEDIDIGNGYWMNDYVMALTLFR